LVDDHGHTLLAMVDLTAEDPNGLGVIDEDVEDRCEWLVALNRDESRSNTGADGRCQVSSERFARLGETGLCDCVVLETSLDGFWKSIVCD